MGLRDTGVALHHARILQSRNQALRIFDIRYNQYIFSIVTVCISATKAIAMQYAWQIRKAALFHTFASGQARMAMTFTVIQDIRLSDGRRFLPSIVLDCSI